MPIRFNLRAEPQAAEDLRRRDPVKRAIWIGGFLVCVTLLWCGKLQFDIWREGMTRSRLEKDWAIKEPKFKTLTAMQNKAERLEGMLSNLDRYTTNRLLWANALNAIQKSMVEDIQLTRIRTEQSYEISAPQSQTNTTTTGLLSAANRRSRPKRCACFSKLAISTTRTRPGQNSKNRLARTNISNAISEWVNRSFWMELRARRRVIQAIRFMNT